MTVSEREKISFNIPPVTGKEIEYIADVIKQKEKLCGDGPYTKKCSQWLENRINSPKCLLTTSGTHALEMAAILSDIQPGDEVIMPSFTFVSTANAFVLRGAKIVFVDIRQDTMNIDESLIEDAITEHTKAIVPVHYAGVSCEMDTMMDIAERHKLFVIEDAAQAIGSDYKGKKCGAIGDTGCLSFHETKNVSMGEGGALLIKNESMIERAEFIREKGTNRSKFYRGEIDKYTWVDLGSSYLPSELNAAYLWGQLLSFDEIEENRIRCWNRYYELLENLENKGFIQRPVVPDECTHNAHMFYIKVSDIEERSRLISFLKEKGIGAVFHYIPLHSAPAGKLYGEFHGEDKYTTVESERLLRLPMHYELTTEDVEQICETIEGFYS